MRREPQAAPYRPDPAILPLAEWIADPVSAAQFPQEVLRFRNARAAATIGLSDLSDAQWCDHFARFEPLPENLPEPLALRYHGHQFQVYNPDLGDGRGFLFAQVRDTGDRLLDLGTKGSGRTPYSRAGDGRLTLKGAVRELLATEMLEALGVHTSRTFSIVETFEDLVRPDEPSPARSAVLVRLSHSHIRIGSFQRLAALGEHGRIADLARYTITNLYGRTAPRTDAEAATVLIDEMVERLADLAASYMVAGFVHGVLNTDNMNVTGESFDYGPWRFAPKWEPGFTAAYFDRYGLYAFGRQAEAIHWNCGQQAIALRPICPAEALRGALERFGPRFRHHLARRWCWRLGVEPQGTDADLALVEAGIAHMRDNDIGPDEFFARHRGDIGISPDHVACADAGPIRAPQSMLIDEVETIWSAIAERDDWQPLQDKVAAIRAFAARLGKPPRPARYAG